MAKKKFTGIIIFFAFIVVCLIGKLKRIPHPKLQQFLCKHRFSREPELSIGSTLQKLVEIDEQELQDEEYM